MRMTFDRLRRSSDLPSSAPSAVRRKRRRLAVAAAVLLVAALLLVDPAPLPPRYIGGEPLAPAGDLALDVQRAVDRHRREGRLPDFLPARSPGVEWRWPPVGWVNTYDDPVNMLLFVRNATREGSVSIVKEAFEGAGYSGTALRWFVGFFTRYDRPVEAEMLHEFTAGGLGLQMHLRALYAGEDPLLGHGFLINGHAEFRDSDPWSHISGRIPADAVEAGPYLDARGVKWESFERHIEATKIFAPARIFANYSNGGYYLGPGRAPEGDPYHYVDGRIPVAVLEAR